MDEDGTSRPRLTARQVRDVLALLLLLAGTVGLVCCAFAYDPLLGWSASSTSVLALGVLLGFDR